MPAQEKNIDELRLKVLQKRVAEKRALEESSEAQAQETVPEGEAFPTIKTPRGTLEILARSLDTPAAALRAGINAGMDPNTSLSHIGEAVVDRLKYVPGVSKEAPNMSQIISRGARKAGISPSFADITGKTIGPPLQLYADPLNLAPVGEMYQGAKALVKGADVLSAAEPMAKEMLMGAEIAVPEVVEKGPSFTDKMITSLFGPGEEAIAAYRKNPRIIEQAPGIKGIRDKLSGGVKKIKDKVREEKIAVEQARSSWDDAYKMKLDELKAAKPPQERAGEVISSLDDLKKDISRQSLEAFDILDKNGVMVETPRLKAFLTSQINKMGELPSLTKEGVAALENLKFMRDQLGKYPKEISGAQAKVVIQDLDAAREAAKVAGQHFDREEQIKRLFRGKIDEQLKDNEEYEKAMKWLSADTQLLTKARDVFGNPKTIEAKLKGIHKASQHDLDLLKQLSDRMGLAIDEDIATYSGAQSILKNREALDQIRNSLPEAQAYKEAQISHDLFSEEVDKILTKLGGVDSTETVAKMLLRKGAGEETGLTASEAVLDLNKIIGVDVSEDVAAEKLKRAFEGGRPIGSRAVNLGANAGEALAVTASQALQANLSAKMGPIGKALGSFWGAYVDKYGGQMAKKAIDMDIARKAGTLSFNESKSVPKALLNEIWNKSPRIARLMILPDSPVNLEGEMLVEDPETLAEVSSAVENSKEMSHTEKAKFLSDMNKRGGIKITADTPQPEETQAPVEGDVETLLKALQPKTGG